MTSSSKPSQVAFYVETTQGTGPADGSAWVTAVGSLSTGARLRHIGESLDVSGIEQQVVEDERSQLGVWNLESKVKGLRNTSFPMNMYFAGSGITTSAAAQMAVTAQGVLLGHCFGGSHRCNTTLLAGGGHTTTVINVTSATNIVRGCLVKVLDDSTGEIAWAEVTDVDTLAITLDEALPFTPADGDSILGTTTIFPDESVLMDSAVGPTTFSWLIQKGSQNDLKAWELNGAKTELKSISLSRGALPLMSFETQAASFDPPQTAPNPTWAGATIHGSAPVSIGPDTVWVYQTYGTTTRNAIHVSESSIEIGIPVIPDDTNTEVEDGMEGRRGYATGPADTMITLNVTPMASTPWTDFSADTYKRLRFYRRGSEGQTVCIHFSRCELLPPKQATASSVLTHSLTLRAHQNTPNADASADIWEAKVKLGF
jgi:hypothetical protein